MRFEGTFISGKTIRLKGMKLMEFEPTGSLEALGAEYNLRNSVAFQTRAMCYDHVVNGDGKVMKATQIFLKFCSKDEQSHTVIVSSEVLKLNRYFTVEPVTSKKAEWYIVFNKLVVLSELQFDMEVTLVEDGVNEQTTKHLALTLLEDEETTDVVLEGSDGKVRAHGCLLAAASRYLRAAFYGKFEEARERRLAVPEANVAALKLLKQFAYTGCVNAEPAALATLLPLASRFLMPDLARACAASLASSLTANELLRLLQHDLLHSQPHLLIEMLSRFDSVKIEEIKENNFFTLGIEDV